MTGRAIIFIVVGMIITSGIVLYNIEAASTGIVSNFTSAYLNQTALNIAQSGVNMGLLQLANNASWRTGFPLMDMLGGKVIVTAQDTTYQGGSVVMIRAIGIANYQKSGERRDTSIAYVGKTVLNPIPVKGLLQSNGPVGTAGGIVLDGRNHTLPPPDPPTLIDTTGTYAVWCTTTFSVGGSSKFGGTVDGKDYLPLGSTKKNGPTIMENQTYPGGYPLTPDSAAGGTGNGYPEGKLKSIAQSGAGGSQYVTDPLTLKYPLKGVTYVELPAGTVWGSATVYGSGILIVHNSARNAAIKNAAGTSANPDFVGLVIADDIVHIQGEITGAVIELSPTPSEGTVIGNSNGNMWFSRQAVLNATSLNGSSTAIGSAANVIAWWE
ncbi:MAG TPA: hypothetical protein VI215_04890 [Bacteroidota bacterium]|jgi:hypothetical protein